MSIKSIARRRLSDRQYRSLSWLKNKTIPHLWYRLGQSPFLILGSVVKLMPGNSQVTIKSGINITKQLDYSRRDIFLHIESDFEYLVRRRSCKKEPETVQWLEASLHPGDVLYDVGANIGAYSLVASKYLEGDVKVYAFEPSYVNFSQLCRNVQLNDCQDSVIPLQLALSDYTSIDTFNFRNLYSGAAIHALGEAIDVSGRNFVPAATQPVIGFRADELIEQFGIPPANHIKIDVDGIEFQVLQGMDRMLSGQSVYSLMVEINEARACKKEVLNYLEGKGFLLDLNVGANHIFSRATKLR